MQRPSVCLFVSRVGMTFAWRIESVFAELPEVLMRHDGVVLTFPKAKNSLHTGERHLYVYQLRSWLNSNIFQLKKPLCLEVACPRATMDSRHNSKKHSHGTAIKTSPPLFPSFMPHLELLLHATLIWVWFWSFQVWFKIVRNQPK